MEDSEEPDSDGEDSTSEEQRSSEDMEELDNFASFTEWEPMNSLDADGPEECLELESSEDSEEEQIDALPTEKEDGLKLSAGISEEDWLEDS